MSRRTSLLIIVFLIFALAATVFLALRTTVFFNQAYDTSLSTPVSQNSYLFASPLQAKSGGAEKIRVTVFLLDSRGIGVANQLVTLNRPQGITQTDLQSTTDDTGKAVFDITSLNPGRFDITAQSGNFSIPQKVKVIFY